MAMYEIYFKLTNSISVSIEITECGECPFDRHFPSKLEPGMADDAHATKAKGVYCCPAYTIKIGNEEVKVNASYGGEYPTAVYTEGDFLDYRVELVNPPPTQDRTMTCIAEVKKKF